jgi:twinkle protein
MAVNQQTGYSAISLPQGSHTIHEQLIPLLNQFEKIVLWLDNDEAGRLG